MCARDDTPSVRCVSNSRETIVHGGVAVLVALACSWIATYPEVPAYPASHGCVRVPEAEAARVWRFGRIGMRVWTG
jgi:hypothetical protein